MSEATNTKKSSGPLKNLEEWDEFIAGRYPAHTEARAGDQSFRANDPKKRPSQFRDYDAEARNCVKEFYRLNHQYQTLEFVLEKEKEYLPKKKQQMSIWEAMEMNTLIDESDPDTDVPQIEHCLQTAEAIRRAGHPDWFVLAGFIHDLGKILAVFGEPQWAVTGDTFPVGCAHSHKIVYPEFFGANPDSQHPVYSTKYGIYSERIGLNNVHMSWGHDEYVYQVVKDHLPEEALYMLRYHSFYAAHREGAYEYLMNENDKKMFRWVRAFNPFDLYSKSHERPNVKELMTYYRDLVARYFPKKLAW
ncbi:MAG TPA: inositol oxygenase family protein [Acidobacteriota bacterium]